MTLGSVVGVTGQPHWRGVPTSTQEGILSTMTTPQDEVIRTPDDSSSAPARKYRTPVWFWVVAAILAIVCAVTFIPAMTGHPHQPGVGDFFPDAIFGKGTVFEFNRMSLARLIVAVVLCIVFVLAATRLKLVPGRGQSIVEYLADFVRNSITIEMLGEAKGRKYAPFIGFILIAVFGMNIVGVIPGINIAASSVMAVPVAFALISYVGFVGAGIKAQGAGHFFKSQLFPPGIPWPIYILLTPIEFFSTFVVRPVTLAIRLLCNMISGHLLLAMCYFGTATLLAASGGMKGIAALTGVAAVVVTLFEIFIAALQAYIFAVLTTVYIKLSVESH